ncbi:MAG TPA: hypothetical protein VFX47_02930 [Gammaproteobacteria bacterium]|nr:hypothetical protein [Gammaproteobacteria bacterium]
MTQQRKDGVLVAVSGQSRWGKTASVLHETAKHQRVIVWDARGEYPARGSFERIGSIRALVARLAPERGPARIAYCGRMSEFDAWARCAYLWGQLWPCTVIADELADVTSPGKAPDGWGQLVRKGLYFGIHIYAITHRPAESDKTVFGNATLLRCFGLRRAGDREYMARELDVSPERIASLQKLEYIQRRAGDTKIYTGKVSF